MCGIVGIAGTADVAPQIVEALRRLEYRGYDSAGIATLVDGHIERRRSPGKLSQLDAVLHKAPLGGHTGIGHTRWATHGKPTEANAHPHATARVAIVHNGIIENFRELSAELAGQGPQLHIRNGQRSLRPSRQRISRFRAVAQGCGTGRHAPADGGVFAGHAVRRA